MITFSEPTSKFFGVYHDMRLEHFASVETALKAGAFAVVELIEKIRYNDTFKNAWYDYKIYNEKSMITNSIRYLKWGLELKGDFTSSGGGYDHIAVVATIIDPFGKKNLMGERSFGINGVASSLQILKEISVFESYQNYSLSRQVQQLEKEVAKLKKQLSEK